MSPPCIHDDLPKRLATRTVPGHIPAPIGLLVEMGPNAAVYAVFPETPDIVNRAPFVIPKETEKIKDH